MEVVDGGRTVGRAKKRAPCAVAVAHAVPAARVQLIWTTHASMQDRRGVSRRGRQPPAPTVGCCTTSALDLGASSLPCAQATVPWTTHLCQRWARPSHSRGDAVRWRRGAKKCLINHSHSQTASRSPQTSLRLSRLGDPLNSTTLPAPKPVYGSSARKTKSKTTRTCSGSGMRRSKWEAGA